jgi:hypothetical protein
MPGWLLAGEHLVHQAEQSASRAGYLLKDSVANLD